MTQRGTMPPIADAAADILELQRLVLDFALRDQGRWDELAGLFQPQAPIIVSWYAGPIEGFIAASRALAERGSPPAKHLIGTPRVTRAGARAAGETDVVIAVRLPFADGEVDITSWARFHDLFARDAGIWRIARRDAVYERDRADPVGGASLGAGWSNDDLAAFPPALKHLAKMLSFVGKQVVPMTAVGGSHEERTIRERQAAWLAGDVQQP
jgi:hypothetical protein